MTANCHGVSLLSTSAGPTRHSPARLFCDPSHQTDRQDHRPGAGCLRPSSRS